MSADNYYLIRTAPEGGFCAVMGFASEDGDPKVRPRDQRFDTVDEALVWANGQYSEYGVSIHDECEPYIVNWKARAERAEADADRLAAEMIRYYVGYCGGECGSRRCTALTAHDEAVIARG